MANNTVTLTLRLKGQQAQQVLNQLNQAQTKNTEAVLRTNRLLEGVLRQQSIQTRIQSQQLQQLNRLGQQNLNTQTRTTQSSNEQVRSNRLLENMLRQQQRQSSLLSQQIKNQNRDYQLQLNTLRQQVAEAQRLRDALRGARQEQQGVGGAGRLGTVAGVVGGGVAAGMTLSNYLKDPRTHMRQIALSTDTALAGQNMTIPQFNAKVKEMEGFARNAAVVGGSNPQQVGAALNTLTASNVYDFKEYKDVLLQVSKTAFASGADANDVAAMAVAQKNFGLTDLSRANDMAFRSGQLGSFELRDMARYMPDILTQGKNAGYIGESGFRNLLTMMQMSKKTAGTSESAAVNLSDLLGSFSQYHLGLQMAKFIKLDKGDPIAKYGVSKKRSGFDWSTYVTNMRAQGVGEVEAAAMLMQRQMSKNPLFQDYQKKLQNAQASGDTKAVQENLQAAVNIAAQSEIGKIFHNKQALMAFMGITMNMGTGGAYNQVDAGTGNSQGAIDASHARQASQEYAKDGSLDTARFNARVDVYNGAGGWLGDVKQWFADVASDNNDLAAAASAAVAGLTAVAAAGGIAALAMRGGGAGAGAAAGIGAAAARGGAYTLAAAAGGGAGWWAGTQIRDSYMKTGIGQEIDNAIGATIAIALAAFGNDEARAALESKEKYNEMLKEQREANQLSKQMVQKLDNFAKMNNIPPVISFNGLPLMGAIDQQAGRDARRNSGVVGQGTVLKY